MWWADPGERWDLRSDYHPEPMVTETDQEPWGTLLGPDGEPIGHLVDKRRVPFGFQIP